MTTISDTLSFYRDLKPVNEFARVLDADAFVEAPDDWSVVLTDVRGSTKAIEEGRYRDVNMMGAAGLAAIKNTLREIDVPCVFGGDGATMLVPTALLGRVRAALEAVQALSKDLFNLELRAGSVPVAELHRENVRVQVAKYQISPGNSLAQFRGGGLAKAEAWIKAGDPRTQAFAPTPEVQANLDGLTCRWQPFQNRRGQIMTLLVMATPGTPLDIYPRIVARIEAILGMSLTDANPATAEGMRGKWPSMSIFREARVQSHQRLSMRKLVKAVLVHAFVMVIVSFKIRIGGFDPVHYKRSTVLNSDHKKFDDMLRMVIDCSTKVTDQILTELKALRAEGKIVYGHHLSNEALMTCFVQSTDDNGHVHFIDGSDGGYALAAKELKAQLTAG